MTANKLWFSVSPFHWLFERRDHITLVKFLVSVKHYCY